MELTPNVLQPLGVSAILGVLVFVLLRWIMQLVKELQVSYKENTEAMIQLKNVNEKVLDRFNEVMRGKK